MDIAETADIGVIGGSGLYSLLADAEEYYVATPFGQPSDAITVATVAGRRTAFLPRHGRDHRYPPHRIPYRANVWALRELGVRQILAPCAVGGLRADLGPGSVVVPDQLIDRTSARAQTFYDSGAVHVNFADPYCPLGRRTVLLAASDHGITATDGGTMVVVEGPRFSTRAESRAYASMGGTVINMTGHPEAVLARELAVCYTAVALVTDLDAGVEGERGVTQEEVFRVFGENIERPDLVVLDLMLPGIDGLEVCRQIRARHGEVPVVMLTALGEEADRVLGLELGADDYITKPFSPRELVLRVQSVLRRYARLAPPEPEVITDGDLVVDVGRREARLGWSVLTLTVREFDLLAYLAGHPGRAFTRGELLERVWGWTFGDQSTVTVHIRRLREKIEADPARPARIVTVWGVGYRYESETTVDGRT